jgi:hypothetical protein
MQNYEHRYPRLRNLKGDYSCISSTGFTGALTADGNREVVAIVTEALRAGAKKLSNRWQKQKTPLTVSR